MFSSDFQLFVCNTAYLMTKKNLCEIDLKVVKLGPFFDILQSLAMTNEIFLTTKKQLKEGLLFGISEEEIKSSAILCFFQHFWGCIICIHGFLLKICKKYPTLENCFGIQYLHLLVHFHFHCFLPQVLQYFIILPGLCQNQF